MAKSKSKKVEHNESNGAKSKAGYTNVLNLESICESLKSRGFIHSYNKGVKFAHKGLLSKVSKKGIKDQYKADFVLTDNSDDVILVYTSTSFRTDRFKTTCWDAHGVSKNSEISDRVVAVFFVINDTEAESSSDFNNWRQSALDGCFVSPITHWFSFTEFAKYIKEWSGNKQVQAVGDSFANLLKVVEPGSVAALRGNLFEQYLKQRFNSQGNSNNSDFMFGDAIYQEVYDFCLKKHNLSKTDVLSTNAVNRIHRQSGGLDKVDLLVTIKTKSGAVLETAFSQKISNCSKVSCHEYSADDFIAVLCHNEKETSFLELKEGLRLFQESGNWKLVLSQSDYWKNQFFSQLEHKIDVLYDWAIRGIRPDQPTSHPIDGLIFVSASRAEFRVVDAKEYKKELFNVPASLKRRTNGYPFNWTRASGSFGTRIQLKMPLHFLGA